MHTRFQHWQIFFEPGIRNSLDTNAKFEESCSNLESFIWMKFPFLLGRWRYKPFCYFEGNSSFIRKVVGEMRLKTRLEWPGVEAADHRQFVHLFRLSSTHNFS